jgi:hypothetical protein
MMLTLMPGVPRFELPHESEIAGSVEVSAAPP